MPAFVTLMHISSGEVVLLSVGFENLSLQSQIWNLNLLDYCLVNVAWLLLLLNMSHDY